MRKEFIMIFIVLSLVFVACTPTPDTEQETEDVPVDTPDDSADAEDGDSGTEDFDQAVDESSEELVNIDPEEDFGLDIFE